MSRFHTLLSFTFLFITILEIKTTRQIACLDESNEIIDWYINYKLPILNNIDDKAEKGLGYAYLTQKENKSWKYSEYSIDDEESMLQNTLESFYENKEELTYLVYNDQIQGKNSKSSGGHMKGILAFDEEIGFWIIHSIPKFPGTRSFRFPETGARYGQTIFCITFKTEELDKIGEYLLYSAPRIYSKGSVEHVLDRLEYPTKTLFSDKPAFIRREPFVTSLILKSEEGQNFKAFAKDNQLHEDFFEDIVAPSLKTSLEVQSWRREVRNYYRQRTLHNWRKVSYSVADVEYINLTMTSGKEKMNAYFSSSSDHSKWAVSTENNWMCISDLNHMKSQKKRGGGAVCFSSEPVAKAYRNIIAETSSRRKRSFSYF